MEVRQDHQGRVAVGPTYLARLTPWLRWGAPLVSVIVMPLGVLAFIRLDSWLRYPLGYLLSLVVLSGLMALGLRLVHRTWWWDPRARELRRGFVRVRARDVRRVWADYRPRGSTVLEVGLEGGERRYEVAYSGWDERSFNGVRVLEAALAHTVSASRADLLRADRHYRLLHAHRELADRYGMDWVREYEDPDVFLVAFDARRRELGRGRR